MYVSAYVVHTECLLYVDEFRVISPSQCVLVCWFQLMLLVTQMPLTFTVK